MKFNTSILTGSALVAVIEMLSRLSHVSRKTADSHLADNEKNWEEYLNKTKTVYIERQHDLEMLYFGSYRKLFSKMFMNGRPIVAARNSCEVIAVYNALLNLGIKEENTSFPRLLNYFEKNASVLKGYFGTSFAGIIKYFKTHGYDYKYFYGKNITEENLNDLEKNYATYIFMSYNNIENIADMIHTMSVTKEEKGFFIHNACDVPIYFDSLYEAISKYNNVCGFKSRPIAVLGINKGKKEKENEEE